MTSLAGSNIWLMFIVAGLLLRFGIEALADVLNLRRVADEPPAGFGDVYDAERYARSQRYLRAVTRHGLAADTAVTVIALAFLLAGGFAALDAFLRSHVPSALVRGLSFVGSLILGHHALGLPFEAFRVFRIEQAYGFNRTTPATFVTDQLKAMLVALALGVPLLLLLLWMFAALPFAAVWAWAAVMLFQVLVVYLAPTVIMPLFNRFEPLPDGPVREGIATYAAAQRFAFEGLYTMDGSRRSTKANAFFTGIGGSRRIVLFDTLVQRHTPGEAVAVVAHEMGHYRLRHIRMALLRAALTTALALGLLAWLVEHPGLIGALGIAQPSVYAGLVAFSLLYTPLGMLIGVIENAISRAQEYAADRYAAETAAGGPDLIAALKRLAADSLANLTPHPFKVWLTYSHPPLPARVAALTG